jgi:hypothetical protein
MPASVVRSVANGVIWPEFALLSEIVDVISPADRAALLADIREAEAATIIAPPASEEEE